jgi:predicted AAA+ superfamily ATPase
MKDEIKKIILEWQQGRPGNPFKRDYKLIYPEEIETIIGLRRSGKTYFIFSEIETLLERGVDPSLIMYINFDDERLAGLKGSRLNLIMEAYFELYPGNIDKNVFLFFDEIQDIEHWHLFVKRLYEQKRFNIILTGSSSKLMSTEIATELRGRTRTLQFYPLNFHEFLNFKGLTLTKNIEYSNDRFYVINYASEFLTYGGFPRAALEKSVPRKKEILKDYLDMIIFRDIVERYDVRNTHLLRAVINALLSAFASEFSINSFIKKFQKEYQPNKVTVFNYFSYLEDVGFMSYLSMFSYKIHQRYLSKKVYITDNGFISLLSFRGMEVSGRLLENLVFTELYKKGKTIFYFKDAQNYECDFVVTVNEQVTEALQVTYKLTDENREREIRGLLGALREFGLERGTIITFDSEEEISEPPYRLSVIPFWKWLIA